MYNCETEEWGWEESNYKPADSVSTRKEDIISLIIEWDKRLTQLKNKTKLKPRYLVFNYQDENLYNLSKPNLIKIFRNIYYRILDILVQNGYKPKDFSKYKNKFKLKPAYRDYYKKK